MPWSHRAAVIGARPAPATEGASRLAALWAGGRLAGAFDDDAVQRLAGYLHFARIAAGQRVIEQDEAGDFMLVVLEGRLVVERTGAASARLAEARPGDVLGEMALLDHGPRLSRCTTRTPCLVAVLETDSLARLMAEDAHLALVLLGSLARRLSLRLRQVSSRLSALLAEG
jgi:CRP/FNR family transcriptional regulator, cyclic AMP receptor protein